MSTLGARIFLVICVLLTVASVLVTCDPDPKPDPFLPIGTRLIDAVADIFGGNRRGCNTPCPPWNCQDDSAIIHGYCCGCASWFQSWGVHCPNDLQCPNIYTSPICGDYQWMSRCCCS